MRVTVRAPGPFGATPTTGDPPTVGLADIEAGPRIVFRDNARAHFGVLAMAALREPSGPRAVTTTRCARSYAAMHRGTAETLCLSLNPHTIEYQTDVLDDQRRPVQSLPLEGIPSRARLSRDGTLAATTAFTAAGDSYVTKNFTARTYITTVGRPHSSVDLERFRLTVDGRRVSPIDRNYWGVTFSADDNRFYATVAFGGRTWLVRGDLHARTVTTVHENVECPSLSPDGRTLVYKKRYDANRQHWRLTAVDLRSQRETPLAETRSIDDQVEWLDDAHVMYEVPRSGRTPAGPTCGPCRPTAPATPRCSSHWRRRRRSSGDTPLSPPPGTDVRNVGATLGASRPGVSRGMGVEVACVRGSARPDREGGR